VLRASWVHAARGHNFVRTILRLAGERKQLKIVADQVGAPTRARDIAEATAVIIQAILYERAKGKFTSGLFNLTASGSTSWYGFAQAILEAAKASGLLCANGLPQLVPTRSEDYPSGGETEELTARLRPRQSGSGCRLPTGSEVSLSVLQQCGARMRSMVRGQTARQCRGRPVWCVRFRFGTTANNYGRRYVWFGPAFEMLTLSGAGQSSKISPARGVR